jgi:exonuclease VII large subunit
LKTLQRGYAIVRTESKLVTASADVSPGSRVDVRLATGSFGARVEEVEQGAEAPARPAPERA